MGAPEVRPVRVLELDGVQYVALPLRPPNRDTGGGSAMWIDPAGGWDVMGDIPDEHPQSSVVVALADDDPMLPPARAFDLAREPEPLSVLMSQRDALSREIARRQTQTGLLSGDEANELAVGSVVRWHHDRGDGGLRTRTSADEWTPALAGGDLRQYVLVHDAGATS